MVTNLADDMERRLGALLDRIPGYRGYRSKEDRRDADKRVREHAAAAYAQRAERVERIGAALANQRRLNEIAPVDDLAREIRHLADRVRSATYGYGGLFGDRDIDAAALDQLRLFDEGLLAGAAELDGPVTALDTTQSESGDLAAAARAGLAVVRRLQARFDLRREVVETGKPAPEESVLRALGPGPDLAGKSHRAYELRIGDALAILGDDFIVDGLIAVSGSGGDDFRLFRLGGAASGGAEWLFVARRPAQGLARLQSADPPPTGRTDLAGGATRVEASGSGEGEVSGSGGGSGLRPLRYHMLDGGEDGATRGLILDWEGERQAFVGPDVHPNDVEVFGRPSAQIN